MKKVGGVFYTGVTVVRICRQVPFCDFEVFFGGDVVEAVAATAEELAGITMAV